ncbi:MAG: 30S ribosomal protein S20 [Patescibacteria group bacterium]|jgi:small subunit ribosomal protein S20|nr:30S ribosomal protein S20 [Patescibacteria group bacterium]
MPVKKSAIKELRKSNRRAQRNRKVESDLTALIRKVNKAVTAKDWTKAADWLKQASKKIDKAAQNKVIKKNTAARKKSRLAKAVNAIAKKS